MESSLSSQSGSISGSTPQCTGCIIQISPDYLSYPSDALEELELVPTATIVPIISRYDNGTEVTSQSTIYNNATADLTAYASTRTNETLLWTYSGVTL